MVVATHANPQSNSATAAPATSIADLITEFHKTTGQVPPLLIGATITLIDEHVYLFGGRLQSTRQISNRLYVLSLKDKVWKSIRPTNNTPLPRYFHSANHDGKHHILFYGGMGIRQQQQHTREELIALNDLFFLNVSTMSWEYPPQDQQQKGQVKPTSRYAHISSFVKDRLVIMGGQDINNEYLNDIHIYDFKRKIWANPLSTREYQYGAYRSAAFAVTPIQLTPPFAPTMDLLSESYDDSTTQAQKDAEISIHTYTNFSGNTPTEVTRQIHSWRIDSKSNEFVEMQDQSDSITMGSTLPPPLRFPSAFMCGQQFILAGPHLATAGQGQGQGSGGQYQIWALDMTSFVWTKIEAGHVLAQGSWLKGVLCEDSNKFMVFGHPERSMVDDYRDRVHCFEHIACVNMEIFGIYRPPRPSYSAFGQGLGLSLLKDPALSDLKLTTIDGHHINVNSAIIGQRWTFIRKILNPILNPPQLAEEDSDSRKLALQSAEYMDFEKRELSFPDTYVVLVAFLQFIYTDHLVTAQQHQPHILARLLFIADLFDIPRLKELATHALHQMLNIQTASMIYESAILSNAISLQIRALRVLLNAKKLIQRQKQMEQQQHQHKQQQQQQQSQQQHQQQSGEKPFSSTSSLPHQQQSGSSSRFLQKFEQQQQPFNRTTASRSNPNSTSATAAAAASQHHHQQHSRSNSNSQQQQRSLSTESSPAALLVSSSKSMNKLSTFRNMRPQGGGTHYNSGSDTEYSPLSSATSSPKLTPSSSYNSKSQHYQQQSSSSSVPNISISTRSHTSFWRNNTATTMPTTSTAQSPTSSSSSVSSTLAAATQRKRMNTAPSMESKVSKSEVTARLGTFNFLNNHN